MSFIAPPGPVDPELQKVIDRAVDDIREAFKIKAWSKPKAILKEPK